MRPSGTLLVLALIGWASAPPPARDVPTFTRDIAPILFQQCVACHRPEGSAPFSLPTYRDAHDRATLIAAARGDYDSALAHARIALQLEPHEPVGLAALAQVVAQHPDPAIRSSKQALDLLARAEDGLRIDDAVRLAAIASGFAATGSRGRATRLWERAVSAAPRTGNDALVAAPQGRLEQYREPHP